MFVITTGGVIETIPLIMKGNALGLGGLAKSFKQYQAELRCQLRDLP
jgi:hypothetical protein